LNIINPIAKTTKMLVKIFMKIVFVKMMGKFIKIKFTGTNL